MPVGDLGEGAVVVCFQVAVGVLGPGADRGRRRLALSGPGPGEAPGRGVFGDAGQGAGQCRAGVAGRGDDQVFGVVHPVDGAQLTENGVGVVEEVFVDG